MYGNTTGEGSEKAYILLWPYICANIYNLGDEALPVRTQSQRYTKLQSDLMFSETETTYANWSIELICSSISIRKLSKPMRVCIKDHVNKWYKLNKSIIWRKVINTWPNWQYDIYHPIKREQMVSDGITWQKQSLSEKGRCLWCD